MRRHPIKSRLLALILGALFFGLAPVVHALCVAPVSSATPMIHVMADGSTMVMAAQSTATTAATETAHSVAQSALAEANGPASTFMIQAQPLVTLGSTLVAIGLTILTFFGLRLFARARARYDAQSRPARPRRDRWPERIVHQPYAVSLHFLGISRT
jgi:hypothetical protein